MANRRAMKLFAVALLAGASPAAADTATQATQAVGASRAPTRIDWRTELQSSASKITPRLLANGRAACGNTDGKSSGAGECGDAAYEQALTVPERGLLAAKRAYDQQASVRLTPVIFPRQLANARPACGNTGGKMERPADCTGAETRAAYAAAKWQQEYTNKQLAKLAVVYDKLVGATEAAVRADPTLAPRLLPDRRPACGNTMSKTRSRCDDASEED